MIALLVLGLAQAGEELSWYAVPTFGYDTDDGFGYGARAELAWKEPGYSPYRFSLMVHAYATTAGFQHHRLRLDRTGLGPDGRLRLTGHLAWRQWRHDGWWGLGNAAPEDPQLPDAAGGEDPYDYALIQPFAHLAARLRLPDQQGAPSPWSVYAALDPRWSRTEAPSGSLLSETRPYGDDGGFAIGAMTGLIHDTRQPEINPDQGHAVELSGRWFPPLPGEGESNGFGGPLLSLRGWWSPAPRLTLAGRAMAEHLFGQVPFYEMAHWGGLSPIAGVGGADTVRGLPFGRFHAPGKLVLNAELRCTLHRGSLRGDPLEWELSPFADAVRVWGAEPAQADLPLHPAAGGGLRLIYDQTFVGRLDMGVGWAPTQVGPAVEPRPSFGLYLAFDHPF